METELLARLAEIPGSQCVEERADGLWMTAPQLDVEAMAREMKALGFRLVTMTGVARDDGETTIIYHYSRRGQAINFKTVTRGGAIRSLAPLLRPASWIEREIHDFFAVDFTGHPNLIPLMRPPDLKDGFFREAEPDVAAPAKP
jgi:NADH:ubiquinone oxidoreductase subunit C